MMCEIPIPPSANRLWRIFGSRMHKSKHYVEWLEHCSWLLKQTMRPAANYPVSVTVTIHGGKGWTRARDIDNVLKPCLDLLREAGILAEDKVDYVTEVTAIYIPPTSKKSEATCFVEVGD